MQLAITYAGLAILATATNIGVQDLMIRSYTGPFQVLFSVLAGTGAGLYLKYILDKRFIFRFSPRNAGHDGRTFVIYTATGVATTLVFWAFEFGFDYLFDTREMRYLGAVIGLAIGYTVKYELDRQYTFRRA
ncbi:GtrA family protein [Cupriavidus sp. AcVe19-6a]|uniref:GtrA family protein n=1 Tax=Cupriavidus sp. AcVe19-6a TaxID=2821358 RepID=UPI001AE30D22|nr:GtrA family protein [Cupriavidus sp. AcVe19-6a]MBP0634449.1 GtrA family protein [Cupriavidus sp. AcVe19-6a]